MLFGWSHLSGGKIVFSEGRWEVISFVLIVCLITWQTCIHTSGYLNILWKLGQGVTFLTPGKYALFSSHMLAVEMYTQPASYHNCLDHSFVNTPRCRDMIWCQDLVMFSMHCLRSHSQCPKPWKNNVGFYRKSSWIHHQASWILGSISDHVYEKVWNWHTKFSMFAYNFISLFSSCIWKWYEIYHCLPKLILHVKRRSTLN